MTINRKLKELRNAHLAIRAAKRNADECAKLSHEYHCKSDQYNDMVRELEHKKKCLEDELGSLLINNSTILCMESMFIASHNGDGGEANEL